VESVICALPPGELPDALLGQRQAFFALGRDRVELAHRAPFALLPRDKVAVPLHLVQHRVERSRRQAVAVMSQLVDHPLPINFLFGSMVQHMQANKPRQKVVVL
jgi:hypothetical protein